MPNVGMFLLARYDPPANELVITGMTAKTFFSSTSERTARMFPDGAPWSSSCATSFSFLP